MALLKVVVPFTPSLVNVRTDPTAVFPNWDQLFLYWLIVKIRTMGTSAWVRLGDSVNQEASLFYSNDFLLYDVPPGSIIDASKLFAISQNGDAVIEVFGAGPNGPIQLEG